MTDVGYPVDLAVLATSDRSPRYQRFEENDLSETSRWWTQTLTQSLASMPMSWAAKLVGDTNTPRFQQQQVQQ